MMTVMARRKRNVAAGIAIASALSAAVVVAYDDDGVSRDVGYAPQIDPARFTTEIDNPLLPLRPGTRWVYEGPAAKGAKRIVVEVTHDRRAVMGVPCVVVRETVTVNGEVAEDTFDWYAQDSDGNVWYFGEDTREYRDGGVVGTRGSWKAGVDGAQPGIAMQAHPQVGDRYRLEYAPGEAEDMGHVLSLHQRVSVPFGDFDVVVIKDYSPLDPGPSQHKLYARGVGAVLEITVDGSREWVELVEMTIP
jgi:hypothetical protein